MKPNIAVAIPARRMTKPSSPFQRLLRAATSATAGLRAWRAVLVVLIAAISVLALMPVPPPDLDIGWDKLNHLLAFTSLAFAATLSTPASRSRRAVLLIALLGFGGLIEFFQLFVPGRSAEWADLMADAAGIAFGAAVASCLLSAATAVEARSR